MSENKVTMKEIWDKLSTIDVSELTEKINNLDYLPWNVAWEIVMKHYPDSIYGVTKYGEAKLPFTFNEFGAYVNVSVMIEGYIRFMDLPVMNHAYKAMKPEPYSYDTQHSGTKHVAPLDSFAINKNWQRCLVKCLAINFGLGIECYKKDKDDLPKKDDTPDPNWDVARKSKIGGKGKHKDETWAEVIESWLHWASGEQCKSKSLTSKSINELKFRVENGMIKHAENTEAIKSFVDKVKNPETTTEIPEGLKEQQKELLAADNFKWLNEHLPKRKEFFKDKIEKTTEVKQLTLISAQLDGIQLISNGYKDKEIDSFRYKELLGNILSSDTPAKVSNLTLGFVKESNGKDTTNGKIDQETLVHFREEIEKAWKKLGYHEKQSLNSAKLHLDGVEDIHACQDAVKLQAYCEYLYDDKIKKMQDKEEEIKPEVETDPNDGIVFPEEKTSIANPDHKGIEGDGLGV
jgi:uncharacterized protein DUF1071